MSKAPGYEKEDPFYQAPVDSQEENDDEKEGDEEINYQTLTWWQCGMIMIAETISLGILSLPSVLATIGMVPGVILIAGMGVTATYSGYVIGQFRLAYPWVHSFGDAGQILFEPIKMGTAGRELFGWAQTIFQIFSMASHILTWTICFNTITDSATCTMVWGVIALVVFWLFDLPRTLKNVSYMSIASFCSIFSAVMITMIDVGVEKPKGNERLSPFQTLGFTTAFNSVANITFAFAGHSCFFGFISELRDPKDWPKALALLQISDVTLYLVSAIVIYVFCGDQVQSPALGSAGHTVKKAAWGVAIPTIIIAGVIYGHIAAKYIFVRILKGTKHINKRTKLSNLAWYGITLVIWIVAWIIAESIPNFNDLLALVSALFASWFTYGLPGAFWLFLNKGQWFSNWKKICLFFANVGLFIIGLLLCVLGLWSSGEAIGNATGGHSWSCASNAQ
ncbi:aromatic and neutral aliphatic amino acid permease [Polychaeton citri CBS 116435]|uniref:Aromatic and neutral aliphatic amino acid permease n=1 Tax=Polychaeton citri CBS 116435 TaxID=1314669 RepID=A0A9P4UT93_9PEZI|nr:aromatic and neutral aliphatic amino acid permease [Polychaeton citri CBS 116435]